MLGEALRLIRVFNDLKQNELASRLGASSSHISEIEKGMKNPSIDLLEKYSSEFGIPVSEIIFFSENVQSAKSGEGIRKNIASKVLSLLQLIEARSEEGR
ncbi:helix-turn-helix transcriptional regulator [Citromicrobium bathyomarinum]|uniref:helix-turn-helix transcriptional regulator n=1 Tax=Citromicrobium bathyomarinum TaxID=72174 RepID=UPI001E2F29A1|nr:helix-turn-helix transcriptional regulator [Citromicrobium bathyomarinum]MCD1621892.1 helix-turn-helix domain-containing protein [Citromicrobium bathyomarinum]